MARTFIKICGITRVEDALCAAECGADAIGIVLHANSPREIPPQRAREIVTALPRSVTPVGVFVDAPAEALLEMCHSLRISRAQLHGSEAMDEWQRLQSLKLQRMVRITSARVEPRGALEELEHLKSLKLWRALPVTGMLHHHLQGLKALMLLHPGTSIEALVLDTHDPALIGGSGKPNDWPAVRAAQDHGWFHRLPPIVAAGGLTPDNVGEVIRLIQPWGVDVSSGVEESTRGVKSPRKIEAFIRAVRDTEQTIG